MARCPLNGKPYCISHTRPNDCFDCVLREDEQEKYDRQWDEEYEAYLSSMREEYKEEYETMSEKYTYADVIIDPEDPRVEIGAEYCFGDIPQNLVEAANSNHDFWVRLEKVSVSDGFNFKKEGGGWKSCIIRKKEYTENDIITDVSDPRLKDAIGKTVYVAHKLYGSVVDNANNNDSAYKGVLVNLGYDPSHPFEVHTEFGFHWGRIILSKNQPPRKKYVPFDLSDAVVREQLWGKRIVIKDEYIIGNEQRFPREIHSMIIGFTYCPEGEPKDDWTIDAGDYSLTAEEALGKAFFYDETPCGKLVEE